MKKSNGIISLVILLIVILISLSGCKERGEVIISNTIIRFDEFPIVDSIVFSDLFEFLEGVPWAYFPVDSNLILFNEGTGDNYSFLYKYSLTEKALSRGYIRYGRGPDEAVGAWWAGIYENTFWVFDLTLRNVLTMDLNEFLANSEQPEINQYKHDQQFYRIAFIDSLTFLAVSLTNTDTKLSVVDLNTGETKEEIGEFGNIPTNVPLDAFKDACTSYIYRKPGGDKVVLPYRYTDIIEIYDIANQSWITIQGPEQFNIEYEVGTRFGNNFMVKVEESRKAFQNGAVSDNYIYLLYSGHNHASEYWAKGRYIFVYDWDGNPVRKIILDRYVYDFGISNDDKTIYSYDPETGYVITSDLQ